ncbi:hypothetical protein [Azoarcus sp. DN11]|uniref:hypothetical protein n=1 Tax=Azoarcus sp. DN11 TaxID=356837 RepID=UPI000EB4A5FC|nr:hypothetical protein [Azoarcus sp. DN11]AYH43248.1 hypothetical protein CDA09_07590 [Azoarcus sp. DN11]
MKRSPGLRAIVAGVLCLAASSALAYRPFDGTDAAVADEGEFELEFSPASYLREGSERSLFAPAVVANFGISEDREIVLEGKLRSRRDTPAEGHRTSLEDTALSLKQVHRRGSLQDGTGPSIASECSVLLPTIHGQSGTGASCAGIVSQRWPMATVHVNAALLLDRKHDWSRFLGAIVEGPGEWSVRPVMEIFAERGVNGARTDSALVGLIWRAQENLSFDLGVRRARSDGENISEVRAGLTWAFAMGK